MGAVSIENNSKFSISFGGNNDIDALTLINSLNGTIQLINYIAKEENPDANVKINILGTEKGSFIINLETLISCLPSIFTLDNINMAKLMVETFIDMLNLKKHLKGSQPKEIDKNENGVSIINRDNEQVNITNNVFNIYTKDGDKMISKIFSETVGNREKVSVLENGEEKFSVEKSEFYNMGREIDLSRTETADETFYNTADTILYIKKPDLTGNSQWEFTKEPDGKMIRATINDFAFLKKVRAGDLYINSKTSVKATLTSEIVMNGMNELVKQAYTIEKIIDIMQFNNQNQLSYL